MMKDVGFRIRVQRELREDFLAACKEQDKSAAQVLREYMRLYVEENAGKGDLAKGTENKADLSRK